MNESTFIKQNIDQWKELEVLIQSDDRDPDRLHDLFIKVSSDFAYARTYYPNRAVRVYLNQLSQQVFGIIQKRKYRLSIDAVRDFYHNELPLEIYRNRRSFLMALGVFSLAVIIGWMSTAHDIDFLRSILGDAYVDMTNENINQGDPMAVYKKANQVDMFLGITVNNIRVAFLAFLLGLFSTVGTIILLISNGVMLGAFQYYFYQKGLFVTSFLTIWIHGTLEISAIIIAGAAGIILGNGLLFPGTFKRTTSLRIKSRQALIILISTVPIFILAGFLEGFVTRLTDLSMIVKILIIAGSLGFIIYQYVYLPFKYRTSFDYDRLQYIDMEEDVYENEPLMKYRSFSQCMYEGIRRLRQNKKVLISKVLIPGVLFGIAIFWLQIKYIWETEINRYFEEINLFHITDGGFLSFVFNLILISYTILILNLVIRNTPINWANIYNSFKKHGLYHILISMVLVGVFYAAVWWVTLLVFIVFSPQFFASIYYNFGDDSRSIRRLLSDNLSFTFTHWLSYLGTVLLIFFVFVSLSTFVNSALGQYLISFLLWHDVLGDYWVVSAVVQHTMHLIVLLFTLSFAYIVLLYQHHSILCKFEAIDLLEKVESWGSQQMDKR